jgi:hypothetical protein
VPTAMRAALRILGLLWLGAVVCALLWAAWLILFRPAQSEFSALPLFVVGLPWTLWISAWIHGQSALFNFVVWALCGFANAAILFGAATVISRRRQ